MKYQNLGTSGIEVSRVAFGAWQIGGGTAWDCTDDSACDRIVSALPDMGINFIDTAKVYGTAWQSPEGQAPRLHPLQQGRHELARR